MKILYISHLFQAVSGPSFSVPASIKAQEAVDEVYWINLTDAFQNHWGEVKSFHKLGQYEKLRVSMIKKKFGIPDIVVFEGFYFIQYVLFAFVLRRKHIPYIIVPRSSLTIQGQKNSKHWKKLLGNKLLFRHFAKRAACIQYLTKQEFMDSGPKWNSTHIIIPNGVYLPQKQKIFSSLKGIKAIFIGRLDKYQKGLDLLIEAVNVVCDELRKINFSLTLYGRFAFDCTSIQNDVKRLNLGDLILFGGEVSGSDKEESILQSDLFIMTSRFEGHPMSLIESLSYGIPALVTPGSNMNEEIEQNNAGWSCSGDVQSISSALLQVIKEKELFPIKGANARNLAEKYNWTNNAKAFHDKMSMILSNGKK